MLTWRTYFNEIRPYVIFLFAIYMLIQSSTAHTHETRFGNYRPNYVLVRNDSLTTNDKHIELNLSLRYRVYGDSLFRSKSLALAYSGRFDFFWGSRDSSPVENRLNNPELLWRDADQFKYVPNVVYHQLGFGHESNGQSIDSIEEYETRIDENRDDHVSRGWDYISYETKFRFGQSHTGHFLDDERSIKNCNESTACGEIWWAARYFFENGPLQGEKEEAVFRRNRVGRGIASVDGLTTIINDEYIEDWGWLESVGLSLSHTTGVARPFLYNTLKAQIRTTITFPKSQITLPLFFTYFSGYGEELTDYANRTSYFAVGIVFR